MRLNLTTNCPNFSPKQLIKANKKVTHRHWMHLNCHFIYKFRSSNSIITAWNDCRFAGRNSCARFGGWSWWNVNNSCGNCRRRTWPRNRGQNVILRGGYAFFFFLFFFAFATTIVATSTPLTFGLTENVKTGHKNEKWSEE